jgi:transposase-like protein
MRRDYLDATYLQAAWAGAVRGQPLLVSIGVSEEGFREVPAVEVAPGEHRDGY